MLDSTGPDLRNMHALVTGVEGFLGRALAKHLRRAGVQVVGIDLYDSGMDLSSDIEYHQTDILDFDLLFNMVSRLPSKNANNTVVFHLAGQSHVGKCRAEPLKALALNVMGTANLLEACRLANVKWFIFPSTALVYATPALFPVKENDAVRASSIYAATKLASESLLQGYSSDYGFTCRIARLGNVYGPGGMPESVVGTILRQVKSGGPILLKTLAPVRDFIYRDDVVRGLIALATHGREPGCEIFNLSSGIPTSVRELAIAACRVSHLEAKITETEAQPGDAEDKLVLSIQRLAEQTQWRPEWTLEDGLGQTLSEMESVKNE